MTILVRLLTIAFDLLFLVEKETVFLQKIAQELGSNLGELQVKCIFGSSILNILFGSVVENKNERGRSSQVWKYLLDTRIM